MMNIPSWFLIKNLTQQQRYAYSVGDNKIEKETDKAVCIRVNSDFGSFYFWCPKSIMSYKEETTLTFITINGRNFAKEFLVKSEKMLKELGLTAEEVMAM